MHRMKSVQPHKERLDYHVPNLRKSALENKIWTIVTPSITFHVSVLVWSQTFPHCPFLLPCPLLLPCCLLTGCTINWPCNMHFHLFRHMVPIICDMSKSSILKVILLHFTILLHSSEDNHIFNFCTPADIL